MHLDIHQTLDEQAIQSTYGPAVDTMVAGVKDSKAPNMRDVVRIQEPLLKQMALIRQFTDHIDSHSPIRYLIAETHNSVEPMVALIMRVDKHIDLCPLFEDRLAYIFTRGFFGSYDYFRQPAR